MLNMSQNTATILNKVAGMQGYIQGLSEKDDPALLKLGATLVRFLRQGDLSLYQNEAFVTGDLLWAQFQKTGRKGPTRQEMDQHVNFVVQQETDRARTLLQQMTDEGIDLKNAEIQVTSAKIAHADARRTHGTLDGLTGDQFKLTLRVTTDAKAKNGAPLSGEYVVAAVEVLRFEDDWRIAQNVHWEQFPPGVADPATVAKMEFENFVAEYGFLPAGIPSPEIEFTTLAGGRKMKLSDLRGQVVVLDFWATSCGACQKPLADLQTIRQDHAHWQDRVAIVPLSIDVTLEAARQHVDQRGWTNTFNVWAGEGGWHSAPAKAFRVTAVPTTYVLDTQGKIVASNPGVMNIAKIVDGLLKP